MHSPKTMFCCHGRQINTSMIFSHFFLETGNKLCFCSRSEANEGKLDCVMCAAASVPTRFLGLYFEDCPVFASVATLISLLRNSSEM